MPQWARGGLRLIMIIGIIVLAGFWLLLRMKSFPSNDPDYEPLGEKLYGAGGIKARSEVCEIIDDLSVAMEKSGTEHFSVLPGIPAWWISPERKNPLPLYVYEPEGELLRKRIINRLKLEGMKKRGKHVMIIQKYLMRPFPERRIPPDQRYPLYSEVKSKWKKKGETKYFIVYE